MNFTRRDCTWLRVADLIFVDSPVGVGFSYADHPRALAKTDAQVASDMFHVIQLLLKDLPSLQKSPLYLAGESYGGKTAAQVGVLLARGIQEGTISITLGGVAIGDGWISPGDFTSSYGTLLNSVSRLNDNAVADVNKMGMMVNEQMAAGHYAKAQKTWTDQLDLIDSQSDSINIDNFLLDAGMNPVLANSTSLSGSQLMYHSSLKSKLTALLSIYGSIDEFMNKVIESVLEIIPKSIVWGEAMLAVYDEMKDDFMKPSIDEVDELLSRGISVTIYQGQYDVIVQAIGSEAWVKKLKWDGLKQFLCLTRIPLNYCDSTPEHCSKQIRAYVRVYKNLAFYWILGAGHMVPVDQPYPALRMIANITQSARNLDDVTCN